MPVTAGAIERLSLDLSRRCSRACSFCYNRSGPEGGSGWTSQAVLSLVRDCARHGTRAVSFGGGEPLESADLLPVLAGLRGALFRSVTTSGLPLLDRSQLQALVGVRPDKVQLSLCAPGDEAELERVTAQAAAFEERGVRSGVNLLVRRASLAEARRAAARLQAAGIDNRRIVYLPLRGQDTPSPEEVALVAGGPFQAPSCLTGCRPSPRFCSLGWDRSVGWCSHTSARAPLPQPTHAALLRTLARLALRPCSEVGGDAQAPPGAASE